MNHLLRSLAVLSALALPLAAHAGTFAGTASFSDTSATNNNFYNLSGSFDQSSFNFTGPVGTTYTDKLTVTSDFATGHYYGNAASDNISVAIHFSQPNSAVVNFNGTGDDDLVFFGLFNSTDIDWASNSQVVTFADGSSVLLSLPDFDFSGSSFDSTSGSENLTIKVLTGSTATPEPSTFALLGTGLLGAAGAVRRKFSL